MLVKIPRAIHPMLLLYVNNRSEIIGRTRLEKLIFLIQKELIEKERLQISEDTYEFRPYRFGPFSEDVLDDVELLIGMNIIKRVNKEGTDVFKITEHGTRVIERLLSEEKVPRFLLDKIGRIKKRYNDYPLNKLIKEVYQRYPDYTILSEVVR